MAQQVVVAVLKKQILAKQAALIAARTKRDEMSKKREDDAKKVHDEYEAALKKWEADVLAIAIKTKLTKDNSCVSNRGYGEREVCIAEITIPAAKLPKRPERKALNWDEYHVDIPVYYDSYHHDIAPQAVLAHWARALEMIEVLPAGTTEVAVKDFNFLTKF